MIRIRKIRRLPPIIVCSDPRPSLPHHGSLVTKKKIHFIFCVPFKLLIASVCLYSISCKLNTHASAGILSSSPYRKLKIVIENEEENLQIALPYNIECKLFKLNTMFIFFSDNTHCYRNIPYLTFCHLKFVSIFYGFFLLLLYFCVKHH